MLGAPIAQSPLFDFHPDMLAGIKVRVRARRGVTDADVDERVEQIVTAHAKVTARGPAERVAAGDEVCLDLVAYVQGEVAFAEKDATLTAGEPGAFAALSRALIGLKTDAKTALAVHDNGTTLAFSVHLKRVSAFVRPTAKDALVRAGYGDNLRRAKAKIKDELIAERATELVRTAQTRVLSLLERKVGEFVKDTDVDQLLAKQFHEQSPEMVQADQRAFKEAFLQDPARRADARFRCFRARFLDAVAAHLNLEVQLDEVRGQLVELGQKRGLEQVLLLSLLSGRDRAISGLSAELRRARALEYVLERVEVRFS